MARAKETDLRESLIAQLQAQGADYSQYIDLVEDYLKLRKVKDKLITDINRRGPTYREANSTGAVIWKTNPAVKDLTNVSRQMLLILREMNITTATVGGGDNEKL